MANSKPLHADSALIDKLGGTTKAALFFDVSPPSVHGWRYDGLPRARRMYLQLARPDILPRSAPAEQASAATG
jgi:hypothetical protein